MGNEVIFYTQIATIIGYVVVTFGLYRLLVSAKDATIESLKEQISSLERKVKDYGDAAPDILVARLKERSALLEIELQKAEEEKKPLLELVEEQKRKIVSYDIQQDELKRKEVDSLSFTLRYLAELEARTSDLKDALEASRPQAWIRSFKLSNAKLMFHSRMQIVRDVVRYLGADRVRAASVQELQEGFRKLAGEVRRNRSVTNAGLTTSIAGMVATNWLTVGMLEGMVSVGWLEGDDTLTEEGVQTLKQAAEEIGRADVG